MVLYPPSDFPHTPANHHNPSLLCNARNVWVDANGPQLCLPLRVPAITPPYDFSSAQHDAAHDVPAMLELADKAILNFRGKLEEMLTLEKYPDELRVTCLVLTAQEARYCLDHCDLRHVNAILFWAFVRDSLIKFPCIKRLGLRPVMEPHDIPPTKDLPPGVTELRVHRRTGESLVSGVAVYRGGHCKQPADERGEPPHRPKTREDTGEKGHRADKYKKRETRERSGKSKKSH